MNTEEDIAYAASRLKDALGAAADVMAQDAAAQAELPMPVRIRPGGRLRRAGGWLLPLAAAAGVAAIAVAAMFATATFRGTAATHGAGASHGTRFGGAASALPEYYMTLATGAGADAAMLQVRRTDDGAVTGSIATPGEMLQAGHITADASDRAFFVAGFRGCTTATTVSRFYRIVITGSGRISGYATAGAPVKGMVQDLAVSPDGSRIAYTLAPSPTCEEPLRTGPQDTVRVMDLSTGAVRTWQNTVKSTSPARVLAVTGGLSWTPDGGTLVVDYMWAAGESTSATRADDDFAVLGLNTLSSGGSLQANSHVLWHQDQSCSACVLEALAGPDDSLTADAVKPDGTQRTAQQVIRIPLIAGRGETVLYKAVNPSPAWADSTAIFADPSGQWVIVWPLADLSKPTWQSVRASWIADGKLHPLPGTTMVFGNAIAW